MTDPTRPDPTGPDDTAAAGSTEPGGRAGSGGHAGAGEQELLADAVRVLTAAARAGVDWAEFVALACAGAAANIGGVDEILAVRSGSWEATYVRNLLEGTVSPDETALWQHRTEPVNITLNVEDLLLNLGDDSTVQYDQAAAELERRLNLAVPPVTWEQYLWIYRQDSDGTWVAEDPAAPPWTRQAWIASLREYGTTDEQIELMARDIDTPGQAAQLTISKYPGGMGDLNAAEQAAEAAEQPFYDLLERLEAQRLAEQQTFGDQLADRIRAAAPTVLPGLTVPVTITVVVDAQGRGDQDTADPIRNRLLGGAVADTADGYPTTPADLPGTPLTRLDTNNTTRTDFPPAE